MELFIAVVVVLVVLIYFMVVILGGVVSQASRQVDYYFQKNLSGYDEQFKEKLNTMNEMYEEEENLKRELKGMKSELVSYKTSPFYAPRPLARDVYIPTARYVDSDFFNDYKIAKDKLLGINKQKVINDILIKVPFQGDRQKYETVCSIQDKLNFEAVYDLCSSPREEQLQVLKECLSADEKLFLTEFLEKTGGEEEFEILSFLEFLRIVKRRNDPHLFVSVGENEEDYTDEQRNIVCSIDTNICEGLKIIYQNKIYDYSIYKTRRRVGN